MDYGLGNLFSVERAFQEAGADKVEIITTTSDAMSSDYLVLPGVGSFKRGMEGLIENGFDDVIKEFAATGKPLLGICLGMQMLASVGHEFGEFAGLDLIPGVVDALPNIGQDGQKLKVPSIGWSRLDRSESNSSYAVNEVLNTDGEVYLVHSFHFIPQQQDNLIATYDFYGNRIAAAVSKDNVLGFQFHPEKSGEVGLNILRRFMLQ